MSKKILWYLFHPNIENSRGNKALLSATDNLKDITVVDAYKEYGDFKIDVEKEQKRLTEHDLVVFQHPFYWYSVPALFKEWQDRVLTYGFAYPPSDGKALHGKHWLSVITTGGPTFAYQSGGFNNYTVHELIRPLQQTANLCGMRWHPPFIVNGVLPADMPGVSAIKDDELAQKSKQLSQMIGSLNLQERHSLEPLATSHYISALENG